MSYHQTSVQKVKVTHTLEKQTHEALRSLVASGVAKDVSSYIESAVKKALAEQEQQHLELELEAFNDPEYCAEVAQFGDTGLEDLQPFLEKPQ